MPNGPHRSAKLGKICVETDNLPTDQPPNGRSSRRLGCLLTLLALFGMSLCLVTGWLLWQKPLRNLRPFRPEPTAIALVVDGQPQLVTFTELSQNAYQYHNKRIRVTGFYLPLALPDCNQHSGPTFHWAIISQGLQLNAIGFERPLALVSAGSTLTVEGIWRLYDGPAGCGKSPERSNIWYLHVEQIVQPNPLTASTPDPAAYLLTGVSTPIFPTVGPTNTPRPGASPTPSPTAVPPTATSNLTPTVTTTRGTAAPGPTTAVTATTSATATLISRTPTPTRGPGTVAPPTATGTLAVTTTAVSTPTPPSSYPGPGNTPVPPIFPTLTPGY